jgi:hypothetical protein
MPIERIGYRRLYDSMGCSLAGCKELEVQFMVGKNYVSLYMRPNPNFGITIMESDKYVIPLEMNTMLKANYSKDASKSSYPRSFFTEIFCCKEVDVNQEVSEAFHSQLPNSHEPLLSLARGDARLFNSTIDLVAAIIGLRYHWQFVMKLINENYIVIRDDHNFAYDMASQAMEILEGVSLNDKGRVVLIDELKALDKSNDESRQKASEILCWLMRAWVEDDTTVKFFNLFIPLEMILAGYSGARNNQFTHQTELLRKIINDHGGDQEEIMIECLNYLVEQQRPSLVSRFEEMAEKAKLHGWQADILAFKKFNTMRNHLLHRGKAIVTMRIDVSEEQVRELEDLVERYVNFTLFGDGRVYPSRIRPTSMNKAT